MTRDPAWLELDAIDAATAVRLHERFGQCPVCLKNATGAEPILQLTWSICAPCGTRWCVGKLLTTTTADGDLTRLMHIFGSYEELPR